MFRKWSLESWAYPITYDWDSFYGHFVVQKYADGQLTPFLSKTISSLNAPQGANWSDWPGSEDLIFYFIGILSRLFGLFAGVNVFIWISFLLNAFSFYFVAKKMGIKPALSVIGASAFSLSHYFIMRSHQHWVLLTAFHIPFMILVSSWLFSKEEIFTKKRIYFSLGLAALSGVLFVYYSFVFLQLLSLTTVINLFFKNLKKVYLSLAMIFLTLGFFMLGHLDTLFYQKLMGPNSSLMQRSLGEVEFYSLKISDMVLPFQHQIRFFESVAHALYYDSTYLIQSEKGYSYLGLLGLVSFFFVLIYPFWQNFQKKIFPNGFLHFSVYWILFFSLAGGGGFLFAILSGVYAFRCSNRFSLFILAISLFIFLLHLNQKKWGRWSVSILLLVILLDLPPRVRFADFQQVKVLIDSDRNFINSIEAQIQQPMNVFQLPVVDFPESPRVGQMSDYEHLRPALYSQKINWTYGSMRGRAENDWQRSLISENLEEMIKALREKKMGGLYINRNGFNDYGHKLMIELDRLLPRKIVSSKGDLAFYFL